MVLANPIYFTSKLDSLRKTAGTIPHGKQVQAAFLTHSRTRSLTHSSRSRYTQMLIKMYSDVHQDVFRH